MTCPNCGNQISDNSKFCTKCGSTIANQEAAGNVTQNQAYTQQIPVTEPVKKKSKLPKIIGIIGVVIVAFLIFCAVIGNSSQDYIDVVKEGNYNDYPEKTVGEGFEEFFGNPEWEYFESDEGKDIVEFTGECTYLDENVVATIQFEVDIDSGKFTMSYVDFDGEAQDLYMHNELVEEIFE